MSERAISDPTEHGWKEVDGKWMWGGSGGGSGYDDAELRGLISANASDISDIDARVGALEADTGGSYIAGNGITINGNEIKMSGSYSGNLTATDFIAS